MTPEPKRSSIIAIYAWLRLCDDLVDNVAAGNPLEASRRLEAFADQTDRALDDAAERPAGALWPALRATVRRYDIPRGYFHAMLEGQRSDLGPVAMRDFEALYRYGYRVASVVGLTCVKIWGDDGDPAVAKLAEYRGVALQLTNILRDVNEDTRAGRVYLPADELARFGVTAEELAAGQGGAAFMRLMQFQIERARSYYEMSAPLERHLAADCRATSWAIMRTYRVLLERIAANPERVLHRRVALPLRTKLAVVGGAVMKRKWG